MHNKFMFGLYNLSLYHILTSDFSVYSTLTYYDFSVYSILTYYNFSLYSILTYYNFSLYNTLNNNLSIYKL